MCALDAFSRYIASAYRCERVPIVDVDGASRITSLQIDAGTDSPVVLRTCAPWTSESLVQFHDVLAPFSLPLTFAGSNVVGGSIALADRNEALHEPGTPAPPGFTVLAIVPTYNEQDIIRRTLEDLIAQGLEVYVLDNGSTDDTFEIARSFKGCGVRAVERFPPDGPSARYDLHALLSRVEEIALAQEHDWVVLHDADERRRSPWRGVTLRDALWHVDQCGFSCVDHVTLNFWPVDNGFDASDADVEDYFEYFEFSRHPGHFHQRRAWKRCGQRVSLAATAGHDVMFRDRKVYPYKFLLKHYPIRSQQHGERKVLRDRVARWNAQERAKGWHRQYEELSSQSFLREKSSLIHFDAESFEADYLIPRISGVGIFDSPPPWATAPHW